jgi:hypothetical protein
MLKSSGPPHRTYGFHYKYQVVRPVHGNNRSSEKNIKYTINTPWGKMLNYQCTVESGYDDMSLYDTSPIASNILWYQLIPSR